MDVALVGVIAHQARLPAGDHCMSEFKLTPDVAAEVYDVLLIRVPRRRLGNSGRSCLARVSRRKLDNLGDQDGAQVFWSLFSSRALRAIRAARSLPWGCHCCRSETQDSRRVFAT